MIAWPLTSRVAARAAICAAGTLYVLTALALTPVAAQERGSVGAQGAQATPEATDMVDSGTPAAAEAPDQGAVSAAEEPAAPILRMDFPETEATPGQPLSLRLTVLVPTFLPDPPVWPTLEVPNLQVRLPEGATSPTSERIDGATWSGVTRHYRLVPLVPGEIALPPLEVAVTWNDPAAGGPATVRLATGPIALRGEVPEGAEGLDPFLAATALDLSETVEGTAEGLAPGDSLIRTVTVTLEGASPMFVPPLLPPTEVPGLAAYPDAPVTEEREERGRVTGTRTERVSYVATGGGSGALPGVSLDWFDLAAGEVRTATLDPVPVRVDGPPAVLADPGARRDMIGAALLLGAGALALAAGLRRWAWPPLVRRIRARRAAYLASERCAWAALRRTLAARDAAALRPALDLWAAQHSGPDPRRDPRVTPALTAMGAARYGPGGAAADPAAAWADLATALAAVRAEGHRTAAASALPPLNPGSAT